MLRGEETCDLHIASMQTVDKHSYKEDADQILHGSTMYLFRLKKKAVLYSFLFCLLRPCENLIMFMSKIKNTLNSQA